MIIADLIGIHVSGVDGALGTDSEFWESGLSKLSCLPPPPTDIALHAHPHLPTREELKSRRVSWFDGRRVLIVGGQRDGAVEASLESELGVTAERLRWIKSEKNKRARNLKDTIQGLPSDAVVVCVTGKVGHDVSGEVKKYSARNGLILCESRFASQIVANLEALATDPGA
ncbi:hypothetical protein ACLD0U_04310 [Microbacterium sp. 2216-1]|uniref:hypothetical protein n=1 Tax=Microbacterium sp. 2216-1 TaxID=3390053 RepID=UPI003974FE5F